MKTYDVAVIGGGPAGLAAAIAAYDAGAKEVIIFERENRAGGILNQCIHNGFGLTRFKESLTGPEYAARFIEEVDKRAIKVLTETTVLSLSADKIITAISPEEGVFSVKAKAVILCTGCRERSRGALNIAGSRPAGIYSAGTAQKYANIKGYLVGKNVVILGSGDIGLIMARRMTLEGAKVHAVCELMPYSSGLKRNIVQCLDDFGIPLYLSHTITKIEGNGRVTGVEVIAEGAGVELSPRPKGAAVYQTRETSVSGVFACGNALQVHDLVDFVSEESEIAGKYAAEYALHGEKRGETVTVENGEKIGYVLPQKIDKSVKGDVKLFMRVTGVYKNCALKVTCGDKEIIRIKKRVVAPGEMEKITLTEQKLAECTGKIVVSLEVE